MTLGRGARAALVSLGVAAVCAATLATSCMDLRYAFDHYTLPHCPDSSFTLPRELAESSRHYTIPPRIRSTRSSVEAITPQCHGFTVYEIEGGYPPTRVGDATPPYRVEARLVRGPSCAIDVGFEYLMPLRPPRHLSTRQQRLDYAALDARADSAATEWSRLVARLLVAGAHVEPVVPAASSRHTSDWRSLKGWCRDVLTTANAAAPQPPPPSGPP